MATVKLYYDEVDEGQLPRVCMRCGAPADLQKRKTFSWCPGWVHVLILLGLLPWLIVMLVLTKRKTVYVPLCNEHKNHWFVRTMITLSGLAIVFGFFVLMVVLASTTDRQDPNASTFGGLMCVGTLGLLLVLIIVAAYIQTTSIRPSEITASRITLTGVAQEFKEAILKQDDREADVPGDYDERFHERPKRVKSEEFYDREGRVQRREDKPRE
jgi:hypothetical protein